MASAIAQGDPDLAEEAARKLVDYVGELTLEVLGFGPDMRTENPVLNQSDNGIDSPDKATSD